MKKTVKLLAVMICLFLAISLASCVNVDEKVNEATAPLNDKITSLNGQITELEIQELLGLKKTRAFILAKQMRDEGLIRVEGRGDSKRYLKI